MFSCCLSWSVIAFVKGLIFCIRKKEEVPVHIRCMNLIGLITIKNRLTDQHEIVILDCSIFIEISIYNFLWYGIPLQLVA